MKPTCSSCRFSEPANKEGMLLCFRYPPMVRPSPSTWLVPLLEPWWRCGEHQFSAEALDSLEVEKRRDLLRPLLHELQNHYGLPWPGWRAMLRMSYNTVAEFERAADQEYLSEHDIGPVRLGKIRQALAAYRADHPTPPPTNDGAACPAATEAGQ